MDEKDDAQMLRCSTDDSSCSGLPIAKHPSIHGHIPSRFVFVVFYLFPSVTRASRSPSALVHMSSVDFYLGSTEIYPPSWSVVTEIGIVLVVAALACLEPRIQDAAMAIGRRSLVRLTRLAGGRGVDLKRERELSATRRIPVTPTPSEVIVFFSTCTRGQPSTKTIVYQPIAHPQPWYVHLQGYLWPADLLLSSQPERQYSHAPTLNPTC